MHQLLHLLIIDRCRGAALAQRVATRWLLPAVACGERRRAPVAAASWCAAHDLAVAAVGQWIGRVADDGASVDWLMVMVVRSPVTPAPDGLRWFALEALDPRTAAVEYQAWATGVFKDGDAQVAGPFGSTRWIDDVEAWVLGKIGDNCVTSIQCLRASASQVVVRLRTEHRTVYFKGCAADDRSDANVLSAAASLLPESFPRAVALETRSNGAIWWLIDACSGKAPAMPSDAGAAAVRVASDVGRIQRVLSSDGVCQTLAPRLNVRGASDEAQLLLTKAGMSWTDDRMLDAIAATESLPVGWTPLDLDPSNVFLDGRQIRYIDLEPRITAMPMALSIFARRLAATGDALQALRRAYESTSDEGIPWPSVDLVSQLVEVITGWRRMLRNIECGEVSGPLDGVARAVAKRLASAKPLV